MIVIRLSAVPPSLNHAFANAPGKGRVKTREYKAWRDAAGWECVGKGRIAGPVDVRIDIRKARGDIDNRIKAVIDLLVKQRIIDDDKHVKSVFAQWSDIKDGAVVTIREAMG